ncbi:MAG: UvrB/UvrC motif-containing protein [Akkermansia sp.]|nr:UvrB/UvrC motif-containing protein [Akkermansia sp.]
MKKCQICGKRASIYLTQIINGQTSDLALCETCAREKGLFDPQSLTFAEKFFPEAFKEKIDKLVRELTGTHPPAAGQTAPKKAVSGGDLLTECPVCHFKLENFRSSGRLGCADCYSVFAAEIETDPEAAATDAPEAHLEDSEDSAPIRRRKLEQQLQAAIAREDYETAARLRDELKQLD